ncbi:DUF222 domain-containing protein [Calidifontibacter sp. DB0510]|uniref:DUF222 domain-containing protein n=2 Tax=Metallococcus carri TaxID=1656884 RepID=A0A967AYZ0_9MICO|nr:DUF222 domain-containing protein [Metallococcus carri]NOP37343.1 DUF222 domain-containing protein [Calidifontibacter sp. DB2511S]
MQLAEQAAVALSREAMERGLIARSTSAGAAQWLMGLTGPAGDIDAAASDQPPVPGLEPADARRIAFLAAETRSAENAVIADALQDGRISGAAARTAIEQVDAVVAVLPGATREQVFGYFLQLPPGSGTRGIRELTRRLVATFGRTEDLDKLEDDQQAAERVTWTDLPNGMVQLLAELSAGHAAELRHAIDAMSAPVPGGGADGSSAGSAAHGGVDRGSAGSAAHCGADRSGRGAGAGDGAPDIDQPDPRSPGKRRADALMALAAAGARRIDDGGGLDGMTSCGTARLVVTIGHDALTGALAGCGRTESGASLDPTTVRQLACDADLIPMVLGTEGEPLDVGRTKRLFDRGLRRAIIHRDQHCTFPGCDRPPSWCEAHHVTPWWAGGHTALANAALLCRRHHTIVHRDGYTATVTATGVAWDLTPGRMGGDHRARSAA